MAGGDPERGSALSFTITLNEHGVAVPADGPLADDLRSLYADLFGREPGAVTVDTVVIEEGRWFTAGDPSHASIVQASVPAGTEAAARTALLTGICDRWEAHTGASADDILAVALDGPGAG